MNAASQAVTVELTSKIAHLAVLFQAEFANARVDLSPWLTDSATQRYLDPRSIDLSFYFPNRYVGLECRCVLLQVHFSEELLDPTCQVTSVEAHGYDHSESQWAFSTHSGEFTGHCIPGQEHRTRLRDVINEISRLFEHPHQIKTRSDYEFY
ncbi:hypothetical protein PN498_16625 [Oscillatoria sp. CS-180]|uniref:hypothetical protein n=1 Tax=Oscillatoria sp. CS-180 TaxID=3021720 RepID=UPI00232C879B|nr:hypothetical protein [Oscillatoria sp. CS-180]MDB9527623.1 hypothetical protein [Oscillatoria sp. CS-180]